MITFPLVLASVIFVQCLLSNASSAALPPESLLGLTQVPDDPAEATQDESASTKDVSPPEDTTPELDDSFFIDGVTRQPYRTYFASGFIHEFSSSFSDGGSVSVNRGFVGAGIGLDLDGPLSIGLGASWSGDWYEFDGESALSPAPGVKPWNDIQAVSLRTRMSLELSEQWILGGSVGVLFAGEPGAEFSDSSTVQTMLTATW